MHQWGDSWFALYGEDLDAAVRFIESYCLRYGRLGGQAKEKWGGVRFYAKFHYQIHDLIYPGYAYCQWKKWYNNWMWAADLTIYTHSCFDWSRTIINRWQAFIYGRAYTLAVKKWPHLIKEIILPADYKELIPAGLVKKARGG